MRTVSPLLQLYVSGIHAKVERSWSAAVAGVAVALRFIDSLNVTMMFVVVEMPLDPFGGVREATKGAAESIVNNGVSAQPWFPAGSTTVTFTTTDVRFATGTLQDTEWGFVDPVMGPAIGADGLPAE